MMRKGLTGFILALCMVLGGGYIMATDKKPVTEEELKKIDPKVVEKEKIERKYGEVPEEKKIKLEEPVDVKETKKEEVIIKKYRPKIMYLPVSLVEGNKLKKEVVQGQEQTGKMESRTGIGVMGGREFRAYCYAVGNYEISLYPVLAEMRCLIDGEFYKVRGRFVPDISKFMLGFSVSEFEYCSGGVERFDVVKMSDNSPNLAGKIDRKIIENVLARTGQGAASDLTGIIKEHMKPRRKIVIGEGGVVVTEEEETDLSKEIREKAPYLVGAHFVDSLSKELLAAYGGRIPPVFYVRSGEAYYVEGTCKANQPVKR